MKEEIEECKHLKEIRSIASKYREGQAFLVGNGDSQRFWDLKKECQDTCQGGKSETDSVLHTFDAFIHKYIF